MRLAEGEPADHRVRQCAERCVGNRMPRYLEVRRQPLVDHNDNQRTKELEQAPTLVLRLVTTPFPRRSKSTSVRA